MIVCKNCNHFSDTIKLQKQSDFFCLECNKHSNIKIEPKKNITSNSNDNTNTKNNFKTNLSYKPLLNQNYYSFQSNRNELSDFGQIFNLNVYKNGEKQKDQSKSLINYSPIQKLVVNLPAGKYMGNLDTGVGKTIIIERMIEKAKNEQTRMKKKKLVFVITPENLISNIKNNTILGNIDVPIKKTTGENLFAMTIKRFMNFLKSENQIGRNFNATGEINPHPVKKFNSKFKSQLKSPLKFHIQEGKPKYGMFRHDIDEAEHFIFSFTIDNSKDNKFEVEESMEKITIQQIYAFALSAFRKHFTLHVAGKGTTNKAFHNIRNKERWSELDMFRYDEDNEKITFYIPISSNVNKNPGELLNSLNRYKTVLQDKLHKNDYETSLFKNDINIKSNLPNNKDKNVSKELKQILSKILSENFNANDIEIKRVFSKKADIGYGFIYERNKYVQVDNPKKEIHRFFDDHVFIFDDVDLMELNDEDRAIFFFFIQFVDAQIFISNATLSFVEKLLFGFAFYKFNGNDKKNNGKFYLDKKEEMRYKKIPTKYSTDNTNSLTRIVKIGGSKAEKKILGIFGGSMDIDDLAPLTSKNPSFKELYLRLIKLFLTSNLKWDIKNAETIFSLNSGIPITKSIISYDSSINNSTTVSFGDKNLKIIPLKLSVEQSNRAISKDIYGKSKSLIERIIFFSKPTNVNTLIRPKLSKQNLYGTTEFRIQLSLRYFIRNKWFYLFRIAFTMMNQFFQGYDSGSRKNKTLVIQGTKTDTTILIPLIPIFSVIGVGIRTISQKNDTRSSRILQDVGITDFGLKLKKLRKVREEIKKNKSLNINNDEDLLLFIPKDADFLENNKSINHKIFEEKHYKMFKGKDKESVNDISKEMDFWIEKVANMKDDKPKFAFLSSEFLVISDDNKLKDLDDQKLVDNQIKLIPIQKTRTPFSIKNDIMKEISSTRTFKLDAQKNYIANTKILETERKYKEILKNTDDINKNKIQLEMVQELKKLENTHNINIKKEMEDPEMKEKLNSIKELAEILFASKDNYVHFVPGSDIDKNKSDFFLNTIKFYGDDVTTIRKERSKGMPKGETRTLIFLKKRSTETNFYLLNDAYLIIKPETFRAIRKSPQGKKWSAFLSVFCEVKINITKKQLNDAEDLFLQNFNSFENQEHNNFSDMIFLGKDSKKGKNVKGCKQIYLLNYPDGGLRQPTGRGRRNYGNIINFERDEFPMLIDIYLFQFKLNEKLNYEEFLKNKIDYENTKEVSEINYTQTKKDSAVNKEIVQLEEDFQNIEMENFDEISSFNELGQLPGSEIILKDPFYELKRYTEGHIDINSKKFDILKLDIETYDELIRAFDLNKSTLDFALNTTTESFSRNSEFLKFTTSSNKDVNTEKIGIFSGYFLSKYEFARLVQYVVNLNRKLNEIDKNHHLLDLINEIIEKYYVFLESKFGEEFYALYRISDKRNNRRDLITKSGIKIKIDDIENIIKLEKKMGTEYKYGTLKSENILFLYEMGFILTTDYLINKQFIERIDETSYSKTLKTSRDDDDEDIPSSKKKKTTKSIAPKFFSRKLKEDILEYLPINDDSTKEYSILKSSLIVKFLTNSMILNEDDPRKSKLKDINNHPINFRIKNVNSFYENLDVDDEDNGDDDDKYLNIISLLRFKQYQKFQGMLDSIFQYYLSLDERRNNNQQSEEKKKSIIQDFYFSLRLFMTNINSYLPSLISLLLIFINNSNVSKNENEPILGVNFIDDIGLISDLFKLNRKSLGILIQINDFENKEKARKENNSDDDKQKKGVINQDFYFKLTILIGTDKNIFKFVKLILFSTTTQYEFNQLDFEDIIDSKIFSLEDQPKYYLGSPEHGVTVHDVLMFFYVLYKFNIDLTEIKFDLIYKSIFYSWRIDQMKGAISHQVTKVHSTYLPSYRQFIYNLIKYNRRAMIVEVTSTNDIKKKEEDTELIVKEAKIEFVDNFEEKSYKEETFITLQYEKIKPMIQYLVEPYEKDRIVIMSNKIDDILIFSNEKIKTSFQFLEAIGVNIIKKEEEFKYFIYSAITDVRVLLIEGSDNLIDNSNTFYDQVNQKIKIVRKTKERLDEDFDTLFIENLMLRIFKNINGQIIDEDENSIKIQLDQNSVDKTKFNRHLSRFVEDKDDDSKKAEIAIKTITQIMIDTFNIRHLFDTGKREGTVIERFIKTLKQRGENIHRKLLPFTESNPPENIKVEIYFDVQTKKVIITKEDLVKKEEIDDVTKTPVNFVSQLFSQVYEWNLKLFSKNDVIRIEIAQIFIPYIIKSLFLKNNVNISNEEDSSNKYIMEELIYNLNEFDKDYSSTIMEFDDDDDSGESVVFNADDIHDITTSYIMSFFWNLNTKKFVESFNTIYKIFYGSEINILNSVRFLAYLLYKSKRDNLTNWNQLTFIIDKFDERLDSFGLNAQKKKVEDKKQFFSLIFDIFGVYNIQILHPTYDTKLEDLIEIKPRVKEWTFRFDLIVLNVVLTDIFNTDHIEKQIIDKTGEDRIFSDSVEIDNLLNNIYFIFNIYNRLVLKFTEQIKKKFNYKKDQQIRKYIKADNIKNFFYGFKNVFNNRNDDTMLKLFNDVKRLQSDIYKTLE